MVHIQQHCQKMSTCTALSISPKASALTKLSLVPTIRPGTHRAFKSSGSPSPHIAMISALQWRYAIVAYLEGGGGYQACVGGHDSVPTGPIQWSPEHSKKKKAVWGYGGAEGWDNDEGLGWAGGEGGQSQSPGRSGGVQGRSLGHPYCRCWRGQGLA